MTLDQFREYLARNYKWLVRLAQSFSDEAEDALHDKIRRLLTRPDRLADIDPDRADGFFVVVVRNACRDHGRRKPLPRDDGPPVDTVRDPTGFRPEGNVSLPGATDRARALFRSVPLSDKERRAFTAYWRGDGRRARALIDMGLSGTPRELYKDYDAPLHRARGKLWKVLGPHIDLLAALQYHWLWHAINDEICGGSPESPINDY